MSDPRILLAILKCIRYLSVTLKRNMIPTLQLTLIISKSESLHHFRPGKPETITGVD